MAEVWYKVDEKLPKVKQKVLVRYKVIHKSGEEVILTLKCTYDKNHENDSPLYKTYVFWLRQTFGVIWALSPDQIIEWQPEDDVNIPVGERHVVLISEDGTIYTFGNDLLLVLE